MTGNVLRLIPFELLMKVLDIIFLEWTICTLIPVKLPATNGNLVISRQRPGTKPVLVKVPLPDTESEDDVEVSYA